MHEMSFQVHILCAEYIYCLLERLICLLLYKTVDNILPMDMKLIT